MPGYHYKTIDSSATVTTGLTSQQAVPAGTKLYLFVQNPISAVEPLFVNFTTAAGAANGSIELAPGQALDFNLQTGITTEAVNVTATTSAHRYICKYAI